MNLSILFATLEIATVLVCFILLLLMKNKLVAIGAPTAILGFLCAFSSLFGYMAASKPLASPANSTWLLSSNVKQTADFAKTFLWVGIVLLIIGILILLRAGAKKKNRTSKNSFKNRYRERNRI